MVDIQSERDDRDIPLQKVGIKGLRYPVQVLDRENKVQHTTASVNLYVNLPHHFKGTHMSRFIEVFHQHRAAFHALFPGYAGRNTPFFGRGPCLWRNEFSLFY